MDVLDANRSRPAMCWKQCCGYSTRTPNGTCGRKLSELQDCASALSDLVPRRGHGLPLSVSTHAANHHEVRLVQLCFDFYMIEAKPENLIGDRAYDSDPLDEELRRDGIEACSSASICYQLLRPWSAEAQG